MDIRNELKFCLQFKDVFEVKRALAPFVTLDIHSNAQGYYNINTKYLCTVKSAEISGKFRIRSYNDSNYLEFKYKENKQRKKIRVSIDNSIIYDALMNVDNNTVFLNILKKLDFPIDICNSSIKFEYVEIDYIREAYKCIYNDEISRITFDYNIISSGEIINKDICILEIKGEKIDKITQLLLPILQDKKAKYSKYEEAKNHQNTYINPFKNLLRNMSNSELFFDYINDNMNYFLLNEAKKYDELYQKIQFLLYRQIYLKKIFESIINDIVASQKKYIIGIKGYFLEKYYDVPRLYGDVDIIVIKGKSYEVINDLLCLGYSIKRYRNLPFYNNFYILKIFKDKYLKILHSFELQREFTVCNQNINIEIDIQNKVYPLTVQKQTELINFNYSSDGKLLELDFYDNFLYLVNHIMQHLLFVSPFEKNLQINLQKLYDLYRIVTCNSEKISESKLILAAKRRKMIPHLLYVLNIYTKVFTTSNVTFNINNILRHYRKEECSWSNILDVSLKMNVSDIILGDFSKTKMYKLNDFLRLNSSLNNQSLYELKCKILLKELNGKG